jgi:osmotically inducible protein OsmC
MRTIGAEWCGNLTQGFGHMRLGSGCFESLYDFNSPIDEGNTTNRKELLGAAPARCFSMVLALQLTDAGFAVKNIHRTAKVHFAERADGWPIHRVDLDTEGRSATSRPRPSRNKRRAPRRTARSREPYPASTSICEPNWAELQHRQCSDNACAYEDSAHLCTIV